MAARPAWGHRPAGLLAAHNSGVVVTLTVHPIEGPFVRGVPYVWCKQVREIGGGSGAHPTAPIFGRFMSQTKHGPKGLSGRWKSPDYGPVKKIREGAAVVWMFGPWRGDSGFARCVLAAKGVS